MIYIYLKKIIEGHLDIYKILIFIIFYDGKFFEF
jgi:hypothetical protein